MVEKRGTSKKTAIKKPKKKAKPTFNILNYGFFKAVKERWRKPRGTANKKRRKNKWAGALPKIGYKNTGAVRGLREDGRKEIFVRGMPDVDRLKSLPQNELAGVCLRFASSLSRKTRAKMMETIAELGVRVVNAGEIKG